MTQQILAGSISNFIFISLFAIGAYIKNRLGKSNCHIDCGWLTCDSSLREIEKMDEKLEKTQNTQRAMLEEIISHVVGGEKTPPTKPRHFTFAD